MKNAKPKNIKTSRKTASVAPADIISQTFMYLHNNIQVLNNSKIFAGFMIIVLNIASKFVTIKLSKSMESYLKYTFSKQILVFAIAWMGTRDIYIAFFISVLFIICMDYLFNEESRFCCLPESFTSYHSNLMDNDHKHNNINSPGGLTVKHADVVSDDEIRKAQEVLEKAKSHNTQLNYQPFN
jgi:hypothetical protein